MQINLWKLTEKLPKVPKNSCKFWESFEAILPHFTLLFPLVYVFVQKLILPKLGQAASKVSRRWKAKYAKSWIFWKNCGKSWPSFEANFVAPEFAAASCGCVALKINLTKTITNRKQFLVLLEIRDPILIKSKVSIFRQNVENIDRVSATPRWCMGLFKNVFCKNCGA